MVEQDHFQITLKVERRIVRLTRSGEDVGLSTGIQNEMVQGRINERHMGSIDVQPVRGGRRNP